MFLTRTNKGKTGVLVLLSASLVVFSLGSLSAYPTAAQATCKSGRVKTVHQSSRVSRLAKLRNGKSSVGRLEIIESVIKTLKPLDYVHAFWEGGAAAFGRADEWSDIDAYLLVNDSTVAHAFLAVEKALESVSPIKQNTL